MTNKIERREELFWLPTEKLINRIIDLENTNQRLCAIDAARKAQIKELLSEVNSLRAFKQEVLKPELNLKQLS